jgi:acyl-coenzyme A thioesterase PaaI-like protein
LALRPCWVSSSRLRQVAEKGERCIDLTNHLGFDKVLATMVITSYDEGVVNAEFEVLKEHTNAFGTLHGLFVCGEIELFVLF